MMIKDFTYYTAWTDTMKYEYGYAGLIGYQRKSANSCARILWVLAPSLTSEYEAEESADRMLEQIQDITRFGKIMYTDGVML